MDVPRPCDIRPPQPFSLKLITAKPTICAQHAAVAAPAAIAAAENYEDSIPQEVKQARLDELMAIQQGISAELSQAKIGQELKVMIDRKEGEYYVGRTQFDSPEVDPEVLIKADSKRLFSGRFYRVRITNADDFDLYGEII